MEALVHRDIPAPSSDDASTSNDDDSFHTNDNNNVAHDDDDASDIEVPVPKWKEISLGSIYDHINPFEAKDREELRLWRKNCVDSDGKPLQMGIVGNRLFKQLHHMNSRTTPIPKLLYKKKERLQQRQLFMEVDVQGENFIRDFMVKNSRLASKVAAIQADLSDDEDLTNPDDNNKNVSRPDDSAIIDLPVPKWADITLGQIYDIINPFTSTEKKMMRSWKSKCVDAEGKPVMMGIIGNRLMKNLHQMHFLNTPTPKLLYLKKERLQQRQEFMSVSERGALYIRTFLATQIIELVDGVPVAPALINSFNIDEPIDTEPFNYEAPKNEPEQYQGITNSSSTALNHVLFESAAKDPHSKSTPLSKEPPKKREWAQCQNTTSKQEDVATIHVKDKIQRFDDFSEATKGGQLVVMRYYESKMKLIRDSEQDDLDLIDLTADEEGNTNEKVIEEKKRKKRIAFLQQRKEERKKVSDKLDHMFINDI